MKPYHALGPFILQTCMLACGNDADEAQFSTGVAGNKVLGDVSGQEWSEICLASTNALVDAYNRIVDDREAYCTIAAVLVALDSGGDAVANTVCEETLKTCLEDASYDPPISPRPIFHACYRLHFCDATVEQFEACVVATQQSLEKQMEPVLSCSASLEVARERLDAEGRFQVWMNASPECDTFLPCNAPPP